MSFQEAIDRVSKHTRFSLWRWVWGKFMKARPTLYVTVITGLEHTKYRFCLEPANSSIGCPVLLETTGLDAARRTVNLLRAAIPDLQLSAVPSTLKDRFASSMGYQYLD